MSREDRAAMHAMLDLLSDEQYWQQQQARQRPKFKSASMTANPNPHLNHRCERCGCNSHNVFECPFAPVHLQQMDY